MAVDDEVDAAKLRLQARQIAVSAWKDFLESTPPNVGVKIPDLFGMFHPQAQNHPWSIRVIDILLFCEVDGGPRMFTCDRDFLFARTTRGEEFLNYTCKNCGRGTKLISLVTLQAADRKTDAEVMKLGEFPPFGAPVSKRVARLLGDEDLDLYRKGMRSEAQGLGVGAATYFRRIIDNQWKKLVGEIRDVALKLGYDDVAIFDEALKEISFSKAVDMLADAIPPKLRILDGENPLTLLYRPLSVGLHALSDRECLQQAADIRTVLTTLLENIGDVLRDQEELRSAVNRLKQVK
jgi:hypothetical protein